MTNWRIVPLTPEQVQRKQAAVASYQSQTALLHRYMVSFVRANELFSTIDRVRLPALAPPQTPATPGGPPWLGLAWVQAIQDPQADTVARQIEQGADLTELWSATDGDQLHLAVRTAAPPRSPVRIRFYARGYRTGPGWGDLAQVAVSDDGSLREQTWPSPGRSLSLRAEVLHAWVRVGLPLGALGAPQTILVAVETRMSNVLIDRSAWRSLALDGG